LANDPSKCKVTATDISDFVWWFTSNLCMVASFFIKKKKLNAVWNSALYLSVTFAN
jgi:hypothetical protein